MKQLLLRIQNFALACSALLGIACTFTVRFHEESTLGGSSLLVFFLPSPIRIAELFY